MSPRAAARLETLGFTKVFDCEAGKADWFAAGLPREYDLPPVLLVADVARKDDVICAPTDTLGAAAEKARDAGQDQCIVVNGDQIVLGRLRSKALNGDPDTTVEGVMELGPTDHPAGCRGCPNPRTDAQPVQYRNTSRKTDRTNPAAPLVMSDPGCALVDRNRIGGRSHSTRVAVAHDSPFAAHDRDARQGMAS